MRIPSLDVNAPEGFCQCGCGKRTPIAKKTEPRKGWVRGRPTRFCYGHRKRHSVADRFWRNVDTSGGPDACWPWLSVRNKKGYGLINLRGIGSLTTHRVADELAHGPIPEGVHVLHRCDHPWCCNPAHLFRGTNADNVADKMAKGREARGARIALPLGNRKLNPDKVREIRRRYASGETNKSKLGREYGVSNNTIHRAVHGATWAFVVEEA